MSPKASPTRRTQSLDAIFRPRSVAVIGASRRRQSIGREVLQNIVDCEFGGPVYPVNPKAKVVRSMRAYRSLADIGDAVDLAVLVVPRDKVLATVDQCGRHGVRGLVVITAGFKETGDEGAKLESLLARRLQRYGMRMIGPNCMGIINTEPGVQLNATFAAAVPTRGNVGLISQSGALGEAILADANKIGGVAMFASIGNKTDIAGNDLLEYWEHNDDIEVVLMYLESFGNPRRFTQLARRITRRKPILTVKAGRTEAGARAASSHTGSIVGLDIATESLLEQCGVLRVASLQEMFVQAAALAQQPLPAGDRIAIVTNAGGPGILCTDACVGRGLSLAQLSAATRRDLRRLMPPEATAANPVDMIASADGARYRDVLRRVIRDPGVDGVIVIFVSPIMIDALEVAKAIAAVADGTKPVLSVLMGKQRSIEGMEELKRQRVPNYRFPDQAASAMSALCRYRRLRDAPLGKVRRFRVDGRRAKAVIAKARRQGRVDLLPDESRELLSAYGFPMVPTQTVASSAEAIVAAEKLGYPVVLKIDSQKISHKTDVGGVKLDLRNASEVATAHDELNKLRRRDAKLKVSVQKHVRGGREVILGVARDPQFGPLLMFGLGGVYVEVMRDVSVRVPPLTDVEAREMIRRIRGYPLLAGFRGDKSVSLEFVEESLLRLSQLVSDFEEQLAELDINPLIVTHNRRGCYVVDARIRLLAV